MWQRGSTGLYRRSRFSALATALFLHIGRRLCWLVPEAAATRSRCNDLSIVLVTSPIPSHPSTELVDAVIRSFDLVQGLELCPLIIVADGVQVRAGPPAWNRGRIDESTRQRYLGYVDALRSKYESSGALDRRSVKVVGPLAKRVSFGHAILAALGEVHTEFVLVVQHDRVFAQPLDMKNVLSIFDRYRTKGLRYVGFQTVPDYVTYAVSKYGGWARSEVSESETGLIPCFIWYDSTHVCRTGDLAKLIVEEVKPGEFIESSFGCRLLAKIQENKEEWSFTYHMENYGLFLYYEPTVGTQSPLVRHVSGRSFVSREERIKMGWPAERPSAARRVRQPSDARRLLDALRADAKSWLA